MSIFDGYEFESPFLNEALTSYSSKTGVDEEEDQGYAKTMRDPISNFFSGLYRGVGQVSSLIGKGGDIETLKDVGSFIEGSEFAKPDEAEYFKTEGEGRSFAREVAQSIPLTGALAGAAIGGTALTGSPIGGAAAFSAVATPLGLGIRDEAIDTYFQNNPNGSIDDAETYGTLTALAEVFTETAGAAIDYATFKVGGKLTKQALRAGMKSGLIDVDTVVGSIVKRTSAGEFVSKMGFGSAMEGNEEVLNAYLQQATDKTYNVESEAPDYFRTFLLGAVTAAPFNAAGNYVQKKSQDKIRNNLEKGLTSEDVEQRTYTANQIYDTMKIASPEAAEAWKKYADLAVEKGPLSFDAQLISGAKQLVEEKKQKDADDYKQITEEAERVLKEAGIFISNGIYNTPSSGTTSANPYGLSPTAPPKEGKLEYDPNDFKVGADPATRDIPVLREETKVADRAKFAFDSTNTEGDVVTKTAQYNEPITARKIAADRAIAADTEARAALEDNNLPVDYLDPAATTLPEVATAPVVKQTPVRQTLAQKQSAKKAAAQQAVAPTVQETVAPESKTLPSVAQQTAAPTAQETVAQEVPTSVTTLPDGTTVKVTKRASGVATTKSSMTGAEIPIAEEIANIDEDLRNPETTDAEAVVLTEKRAELLDKTKVVTDTVVPEGPANQVDAAGNQTTVIYDPKGWKLHPDAKHYTGEEGKKASVYVNGNAVITRKSAEKVEKGQKKKEQWQAFQKSDTGEQVSLGTFVSKKDAVLSLSQGKSSDEFYGVKEKKVAKSYLASVTPEQQAELDKAGYRDVANKAAYKLGVADDPDAIAAGLEGAARAVQTYKPGKKTTLKSWIYTQAKFGVKSYKKAKAAKDAMEMQSSDNTSEDGGTKTGVIAGATKRGTQDLIVPAEKEEVIEEPPPPVLSMKEIFKKHNVPAEKQAAHVDSVMKKKITLEQLDQKLEAEKALDEAKVSGKERLDVIRDVKEGKLTVEEVKEAYTTEETKDSEITDESLVAERIETLDSIGVIDRKSIAWHGSPYTFAKFSSENINTGEGSQSRGYGLYFAEKREVAKWYKDKLASEGGMLYQVELVPLEDEYLLWDKPLSQQTTKVKNQIEVIKDSLPVDYIEEVEDRINADFTDWTGEDLHSALFRYAEESPLAGQTDSTGNIKRDVAEYLKSLGIRGIKFLDGYSRKKGEGDYNYVVFDEQDVLVTARYNDKDLQPSPTTILRRNTTVEPVAEAPIVTAETSAKRSFLTNATTAEDLFKFPETFNVSNRLKGLRDFLQKVAGKSLKGIKVYDTSEFETRHPEAYAEQIRKYGQIPRNFAYNKEVYISKQYESTSRPDAIFKLILHETVHALTSQGLKANANLKLAMQILLDKVRRRLLTSEQLQLLRAKYEFSPSKINANIQEFNNEFPELSVWTAYGLSNVDEFVAEVFNNEEMFNLLNEMPTGTRTGMLRTLMDNFVNAIRNFLGLPVNQHSVLADVISVAVETMSPVASAREQLLNINPATELPQEPIDRDKQLRNLRSFDTKGKPKEILKDYVSRTKKFAKDIVIGITTRLNDINPNLLRYIRQFEFQILKYNKQYHDEVQDFIDLYRGMKSRDDQIMLDLMLKNSNPEDVKLRDDILKRNGMTESFKKVQKVLEDIYKRKEKVGLNIYDAFPEYFPRTISKDNVSALMKAVRERGAKDKGKELSSEFNDITLLIESLGPTATEADIEKAITSMINTGRRPTIALLKPTSSKERKITKVSSEWNHFYDNTVEALINHIYESNEAIEARVMFGDVKRKALVTEDATIRKQLDTEEMTDKAREKAVTRLSEIEMLLQNYKDDEWKDGIATFMAREGINLPEDQAREVVDLIRGRLTQKGMNGVMAAVRNVSLMTALGGGLSAVTQLGDLALSVNNNGLASTLTGIFGKRVMTPKDLDLSHSMREFQSAGSTSKILDSVLKIVQLTRVDMFGKTVFMNAAISKAKGQTIDQFRKEWGDVLGKETEDTYNDIQSGEKTAKVGFFAFNALSEVQPISMSEMPLAYLGAGNYRIFYALKSYNIKILNMAYKTATTKWKSAKTPTERAMAAKDVGKLMLLLVLGGATADELKDFLMQRDVDFSDNLMNNLFKMSFINRYHMEAAGEKEAMKTFLTDLLVPPTSVADDAFADLYSFVDDEEGTTYKLLKDLPFGRLLYNSGTDQGKAQGFKSLKTRVFEKVKDGASMSEVRKDMVAYNRWAAANGETAISYTSLKNAKKKALKN